MVFSKQRVEEKWAEVAPKHGLYPVLHSFQVFANCNERDGLNTIYFGRYRTLLKLIFKTIK